MTAARDSATDISVIFPLLFVRGPTARAIQSWTRLQHLARDRYEVVVVSPGDDLGTEQLVQSHLGPNDRLVRTDTRNLYALYDFGIQQSKGRIVMITESHVVATRDCLKRMIEALDGTENEAACCIALAPKNECYLATMEAMLFEEESEQWVPEGSWRRVHERGFAIYRDTYDRSGGFLHQYGWFAGREFAARLHAAGVPVGYAPNARVVHYNSVSTADIMEGARSFVFGELRCREIEDTAHVTRYFGSNDALDARWMYSKSIARTALQDRLGRLGRGGWSRRIRALPGLPGLAMKSMLGLSLPISVARLRVYVARARVAALRPWGAAAGLEAYRDYWHRRLVRWFQLEYCRDQAPPAAGPGPTTVSAEDASHFLIGFYLPEAFAEQPIRWSGTLAAVRLWIPETSSRVRIETASIGPPLVERQLALYLDGTRLNLTFEKPCVVSADIDDPHGGQAAILVIACNPMRSKNDPRELGIPVKRMDVIERRPGARERGRTPSRAVATGESHGP